MARRNFQNTFATLGALTCLIYVLLSIVSLLVTLIVYKTNMNSMDIIFLAINICFYLVVALYFYRSRGGNLGGSYYAMLCLALATYLIPFIMTVIEEILTLNFNILIVSISLLSGIIYSIILILESRNHKKAYVITLIVLGIILLISGLTTLIAALWVDIENLINGLLTLGIGPLVLKILEILLSFVTFGFSILFGTFPLLLIKN